MDGDNVRVLEESGGFHFPDQPLVQLARAAASRFVEQYCLHCDRATDHRVDAAVDYTHSAAAQHFDSFVPAKARNHGSGDYIAEATATYRLKGGDWSRTT